MMKRYIIILIITLPCFVFSQIEDNLQLETQKATNKRSFENIYQMQDYYREVEKETGKVNKQFERWYAYTEPRMQPSGNFNIKRDNLLETYSQFISHSELAKTHTGDWDYIGGDTYTVNTRDSIFKNGSGGTGRINCMAVHPNNSSIIYAGAAVGGLWKSTNGGNSWNSLTDGMSNLAVSWITIDPTNTNKIYLAIGDANGFDANYRETGVIYTTNGGVTWQPTGFFNTDPLDQNSVYKIIMESSNSNYMYASTSNGLLRTDDAWQTYDTLSSIERFWDVEFKPGQSDSVYFSSDQKVYLYNKSNDQVSILRDFSNLNGCANNKDRTEIEVLESNPNMLYALQGRRKESCRYNGLVNFSFSTNAGNNWKDFLGDTADGTQILSIDTLGKSQRSQATYDMCFVVDPNDASNIIVGGIMLWTSSDTGQTWTPRTHSRRKGSFPYVHADQHDIIADGNLIYICNDGGLYKSADFGVTYSELSNGIGINQMYDVDSYQQDKDYILGTVQDNGFYEYNSNQQIVQVGSGDGLGIAINYNNSDIQYLMFNKGRFYKTTDKWDSVSEVLSSHKDNPWDTPFLIDVNDPDTLFCAKLGSIWRTFDQWATKINILTTNLLRINEMAQSSSISDRMYIGGRYALNNKWRTKIFRIEEAYDDFDDFDITPGIPDSLRCSGLAVNGATSYGLWACFDGNVSNAKVYYKPSLNGAWQNKTGNLPNVNMNDIIYVPGSNNGVYLATDIGVFYRDNDLGDWIFFSNGLPNVVVKKLELIEDENILRAATLGRGLWESGTYKSCIVSSTLTTANDPSDPDYTGVQRYQVSNAIFSTRNVVGGHGTNVRYRAGNHIDLKDGFWTKEHNLLQVETGPCNAEGGKYFKQKKLSGMLEFGNTSIR